MPKRHALLIGIANYDEATLALDNPINDVKHVRDALASRGFNCTLLTDPSSEQLKNAMATFSSDIHGDQDFALIYFAGHGVELNGVGYILPKDFPADVRPGSIGMMGVPVSDFVSIAATCTGAKLIILDICRIGTESWSASDRADLALLFEIDSDAAKANNVLIAYSTSTGEIAGDGSGSNSVYCTKFCEYVLRHDLTLEETFSQIGASVMEASSIQQRPWYYSSIVGRKSFSDIPQFLLAHSTTTPLKEGIRGLIPGMGDSKLLAFGGKKVLAAGVFEAPVIFEAEASVQGMASQAGNAFLIDEDGSLAWMRGGKKHGAFVFKSRYKDAWGICASPSGDCVALFGKSCLYIFAADNEQWKSIYEKNLGWDAYCGLFLEDDTVWIGGASGNLLEIAGIGSTVKEQHVGIGLYNHIYALTLVPNTAEIAVSQCSGTIQFVRRNGAKEVARLCFGGGVQTPAARYDAARACGADATSAYWFLTNDLRLAADAREFIESNLPSNNLMFMSCSQQLPVLAVGGNDGLIYLIDTRNHKHFCTLDPSGGRGKNLHGLCFVDSEWLVALCDDSTLVSYAIVPLSIN